MSTLTISTVLLLADANWLKVLFFLVVFVIWIINNVLSENRNKAKRPVARPIVRPNVPPEAQPADKQLARPAQPNSPQLTSEIQDFLQRANRKRHEKLQRKSAKIANDSGQAAVAPVAIPLVHRRLVESLKSENQSSVPSRTGGSSTSVAPDLSHYNEGPSRLLDNDMLKSDVQRQAHYQQTFQHQVGRLTDTSLAATPAARAAAQPAQTMAATPQVADPTAAAAAKISLAALLSSPQNLQQAIVMQEILRRPEERWS